MKGKIEDSTEFRLAKETDCTVLITGPTGTGKSRLAARIHRLSRRAEKQFVAVHMSSLHEGTLESCLFGHERGAFTGALSRQTGWLHKADGGTLFLDEVAELSAVAQARLLEFLQTRQFAPLGASRNVTVDVRIICATNRDLEVEVREGRFREDLYHRMKIVTIDLPPLRNSLQPLDEIVHDLLTDLSKLHDRRVSRLEPEVAELLEAYSWPGNYRELRNVLEFSVLASREAEIRKADLPEWFIRCAQNERAELATYLDASEPIVESFQLSDSETVHAIAKVLLQDDYEATMRSFERAYLRHALESRNGHLTRAAAAIRIPKSTFSRRAQALGLTTPRRTRENGKLCVNSGNF